MVEPALSGHRRTWPTRSKFVPRRTYDWQVSGDESSALFGSTRPQRTYSNVYHSET